MANQQVKNDKENKKEETIVKPEEKVENKELETLKADVNEWKGKYLRALADYQNLEKRGIIQRQEDVLFASRRILTEILEITDIFDQIEKHAKDDNFSFGIKALRDFLKNEGVEKIDVVGKKFDPNIMECVETPEENSETVIEEIRSGYTLHGKVIRVSRVKVGHKNTNKNVN
jgi:molecular chaperone GrpE